MALHMLSGGRNRINKAYRFHRSSLYFVYKLISFIHSFIHSYIYIYIYIYKIRSITNTSSNLLIFSTYRKFYKSEISKAKSAFYNKQINNLTSNTHACFSLARKLLSPPMPINIPNIPNIAKIDHVMNSLIIFVYIRL